MTLAVLAQERQRRRLHPLDRVHLYDRVSTAYPITP